MSYYFTIIGTRDNPLFELDFSTSKVGGDGVARFREEAKYMNQFIVHAALDVVEEVQWTNKEILRPNLLMPSTRYLKRIDSFQNNHVHCFLTGGNVKFMLLMNPDPTATTYSAYPTSPPSRPSTARQSTTLLAASPNSQATEEAVRAFMLEVGNGYEDRNEQS
ncbi:TRAPP subunit [Recurvomyces mirabilis]|nr:TRAPP subunit [Recurvomyces mirabilis]